VTVLAVMQPTYLPWIGYFDLIDQSDVFVLYDTVQFEKQSWQQRNRIKTPQGELWLTVPVQHAMGQSIVEARIQATEPWGRKHWQSLVTNYRRAPGWAWCAPVLEATFTQTWEHLADLNVHLITECCRLLGVTTPLVRSSTLPPLTGRKAEPLLELCARFRAATYLSPAGARSYLTDDAEFEARRVALRFHAYDHPEYPQLHGASIPYLSVVDLLMNMGEGSLAVLRSGRRAPTRAGAGDPIGSS
jgi:hypothetical protein